MAPVEPRDRPAGGLLALCLAELVSWGLLYYSLPVAVTVIEADTGWSQTTTMAALSVGLLISALAGIRVGRLLDSSGPRTVMTLGAVLGVVALLVVASAPNLPVFYAGWMLAGLAQSATLYPPAFAVITRWYGPARVRPLTLITLVGGLASTVFAPFLAFLLQQLGWRAAYVVMAGILAVTVVPLHALFLNSRWTQPAGSAAGAAGTAASRAPTGARLVGDVEDAEDAAAARARRRAVTGSGRFVLLQVVVSLATFSLFAVTINIIPLLVHRGAGFALGALALGLVGLGQVAGRLGYAALERRTTPRSRTVALVGAGAVGLWLLALVPGPVPLLVGIAMVTGSVRGCLTLLQATAVSDRWGTRDFGAVNGVFVAPVIALTALAPVAGPGLAGLLGGFPAMVVLMAGLATLAAVLAART